MGENMQNVLFREIYGNLVSTLIASLAVLLCYLFINYFFIRKIEGIRQKRHIRIRSFYVVAIIYLFLMARIWVEGFTHLLAVLGLVSAALVVTNKETIMNFVGWLIITWRELFSEDDLIQIQLYKGYVKSIGILYFSLYEVTDGANGNITGRVVRVPNGLIANNALINFSQTSHLLEQKLTLLITQNSDLEFAIEHVAQSIDAILNDFYKNKKEYNLEYIARKNKRVTNRLSLKADVIIAQRADKPAAMELIARYYAFSSDAESILRKVWLTLLSSIKDEERITLAS